MLFYIVYTYSLSLSIIPLPSFTHGLHNTFCPNLLQSSSLAALRKYPFQNLLWKSLFLYSFQMSIPDKLFRFYVVVKGPSTLINLLIPSILIFCRHDISNDLLRSLVQFVKVALSIDPSGSSENNEEKSAASLSRFLTS